ncbi:MAG: ferric iron uptake transcriptional regulator [Thiotrichaceae bacterium]|nr:ferric iron uptake transcriptional regulator [Thiotrichaceae bacterium]MEC4317338.1 ferric iron uptake transcriptional regulator [Thiotrichaceae bacterium]
MESADLKRLGLKVTHPRMKILELLESSGTRHMSAEEVYKALSNSGEEIGLATVYRVLTQFETAGLVIRHYFENGRISVFELAETAHHDHLLCVKCGKIIEFSDNIIEERQKVIAEQHGFNIKDHCLYIYAECTDYKNCEYYKQYLQNQ